jgi:hypothetical protein
MVHQNMYLIEKRRIGRLYHIFTVLDPRKQQYDGPVDANVDLEYDQAVHLWPDGTDRPSPVLARDPNNKKQYKVFKFPHDAQAAGYEIVDFTAPFVAYSWLQFEQLFPPLEKRSEEEWFDVLDEADEAARARKGRDEDPEPPVGTPVPEIARWIAKRQLVTSASLSKIVYLPDQAPADEIRLLAVNDRATQVNPKPFTYGVELAGRPFKLSIVDLDTEQLQNTERDPALLPAGWSLTNPVVWNRRP